MSKFEGNRKPEARKKPVQAAVPEVVYTQPEMLDRKKVFLRLLTVGAVVMALFVGFSIFFRVGSVEVIGAEYYSADTVLKVSGVEYGDSLLTFGKGKACAKIVEALPYVESVRITIKLPGYVQIYIEDVDVVYSIQDENDVWWLMTSGGRIIEGTDQSGAAKHTLIKGVRLAGAMPGASAQAMEEAPEETYVVKDEEQTVVTVTNGERLSTALEILKNLERNEIIGEASVLSVADMGNIQLWFGKKTQVLLGDPSQLAEKIATMQAILSDDKIDSTGVIDLSTVQEDEPISITPFK